MQTKLARFLFVERNKNTHLFLHPKRWAASIFNRLECSILLAVSPEGSKVNPISQACNINYDEKLFLFPAVKNRDMI